MFLAKFSDLTADFDENPVLSSLIGIYPNPTNDKFTIEFPNELFTEMSVIGIDSKIVIETLPIPDNTTSLDIILPYTVSNEVYFVVLSGDKVNVVKRIQLMRM